MHLDRETHRSKKPAITIVPSHPAIVKIENILDESQRFYQRVILNPPMAREDYHDIVKDLVDLDLFERVRPYTVLRDEGPLIPSFNLMNDGNIAPVPFIISPNPFGHGYEPYHPFAPPAMLGPTYLF